MTASLKLDVAWDEVELVLASNTVDPTGLRTLMLSGSWPQFATASAIPSVSKSWVIRRCRPRLSNFSHSSLWIVFLGGSYKLDYGAAVSHFPDR